jgi:hypothetical protein
MKRMKFLSCVFTVLALTVMLALAACGGGSANSSGSSPSIVGTWSLSLDGGAATETLNMPQPAGATLEGSLECVSGDCVLPGQLFDVYGTISGQSFSFTQGVICTEGNAEWLWSGTLGADGQSMSGTYALTAGNCGGFRNGSFAGTKD